MKVTKYPQSTLVIEKPDAGRVLIDPGTLAFADFDLDDFGHVDAVLYTHRHADHLDESKLDDIAERGIAMYGNADVCKILGAERSTEVVNRQSFDAAGFEVEARDLPHVEMVDGSPGPPNTGYVIDGRFFHPGDGRELPGLSVEVLAAPIAGPSISFRDAYRFVEMLGAETVIPIHYDYFIANPDQFGEYCGIAKVVVLGPGESAEV